MFLFNGKSENPLRFWERGETYAGLMCAVETREWELLLSHVQYQLRLPEDETDPQLRTLLVALATQLVSLISSASNPRNPVPEVLKSSVSSEVRAAFEAFSQTCERLQIVAQQGVELARLKTELDQEAANLRQLLEATKEASAEMARLTLSAGRWQVSDASGKFAHLGWAARELTQFNRELDG